MDKYTNNNADVQISQYAISWKKKISRLFEKN